jgi:proton-coupled amino acid transporter
MADTPPRNPDQDIKHARVLAEHLDPNYHGGIDGIAPDDTSHNEQEDAAESSLHLQGGDIHRDLYRIDARSKQAKLHQRSATFSHLPHFEPVHDDVPVQDQLAPGGFRRQFLERQARRYSYMNTPVTKNFVAFLELYGSFAGEDLEDTDEEDEEEGETRPLLGGRRPSRVRVGDATNIQSFFTLLKAFVGTGIMFLPKAFKNGGMLFSTITLITVSLVTCLCFHLLLQCRLHHGGGYGDFGEAIAGRRMRSLILISITISQIGFVCAGIIFVAENVFSFLDAVTSNTTTPIAINTLIAIQIVALIPLSFIRNISKLGPAALIADVCILIGLVYIYYFDIKTIASMHGFNPTITMFNPRDFTLTIGSAIFTFEGIGLILPIQSSMKNPQHFNKLLYLVMFIITIVFTSVGLLCYGTFGDRTNTEIITNFPQSSKLVNAVQFLYAFAVWVGAPVQLFPPLRIVESKLFGHRSGKANPKTKWKKNAFRTSMVLLVGIISAVGASDLDKFVALIGSFACVPLVYIYPAFLHYKGVATNRAEKLGDAAMIVVGLVACVYTTCVTLARWAQT